MPSLSLISVNIEGNRHLDRVIPFLQDHQPDVVCLQEVFESDYQRLASDFAMTGIFAPMTLKPYREEDDSTLNPMGVAILSRLPITSTATHYYFRPADTIARYQREDKRSTIAVPYVYARVEAENYTFPVATTHFTWTPDGMLSDEQQTDVKALLASLAPYEELIICGDFNAPRGYNGVYDQISAKYIDHIPKEYTGSIDLSLHRNGKDPVEGPRMANFMVDYIFSTPHFAATNVELVSGVSDHTAVVGTIIKLSNPVRETAQSADAAIE